MYDKTLFYKECSILKHTDNLKKIAAALLCAALTAGCGASAPAPADTSETVISTEPPVTTEEPPKTENASAAALASEDEPAGTVTELPLTVAANGSTVDISPFYDNSPLSLLFGKAVGVTLSGRTRNGALITHARVPQYEMYGGKSYSYSGIADIGISCDTETNISVYDIRLRDDVKFSDGETLDADDVIFTLYLHLDPSYDGIFPLGWANIAGAANYIYDSEIADTITDEMIAEALASEGITPLLREKLIIPALEQQYSAVEAMYDDSSYSFYTTKYKEAPELFAYFYSLGSDYDASGKDRDTVIAETADSYGGNYRQLAGMITGDETAYDAQAVTVAVGYITEQERGDGEPEVIGSVSGIEKTGDYSLSVSVIGDTDSFEDALCGMQILPLHYYGSTGMYNYDGERFGFTKGNAKAVLGVHSGEPLGAGAYRFTGHENGALLLEANENYYKGAPETKQLKIIAAAESDAASAIADGLADISFSDGTAESYAAVDEANRTMEKIMPYLSDECGYGFIGINAENVRVGDDGFSEKSYALRRGLATAISFYKEASLQGYFGGHCEILNYPVIDGVVPETDESYPEVPFMTDADGRPIFSPDMSESDREDAVKEACLGFFRAAGFEISEEGIITGAPEGAKTEYSALVISGPNGSHPAYNALKNASELLGSLGFTLDVRLSEDPEELWDLLTGGEHEIWAGAWVDGLRKIYIDGYYGIASHKLEELVEAAENAADEDKPSAYMACIDRAVNVYAAEIPLYSRSVCTLVSTIRVDVSSVPENMTEWYDWTDEFGSLRLKKGQ